jgi:hypothetical protein
MKLIYRTLVETMHHAMLNATIVLDDGENPTDDDILAAAGIITPEYWGTHRRVKTNLPGINRTIDGAVFIYQHASFEEQRHEA